MNHQSNNNSSSSCWAPTPPRRPRKFSNVDTSLWPDNNRQSGFLGKPAEKPSSAPTGAKSAERGCLNAHSMETGWACRARPNSSVRTKGKCNDPSKTSHKESVTGLAGGAVVGSSEWGVCKSSEPVIAEKDNDWQTTSTQEEEDDDSISLGSLYRDFYKELPPQVVVPSPLPSGESSSSSAQQRSNSSSEQTKHPTTLLCTPLKKKKNATSERGTPATDATSLSSSASSRLSSFRLNDSILVLPFSEDEEEKDSSETKKPTTMLAHFHSPKKSAPVVKTRAAPYLVTPPEAPPLTSTEEDDKSDRFQVAIRLRPLDNNDSQQPEPPLSPRLRLRRPSTTPQSSSTSPTAWTVLQEDTEDETILVQSNIGKPVSGRHSFSFDSIFEGKTTTEQVYQRVAKPIVRAVAEGKHGTIFAYGPTGSGKTFTMLGRQQVQQDGDNNNNNTKSFAGIVQMAARDLLSQMEAQNSDRDHVVRAMFFEVYNEQVRDLLADDDQNSDKTTTEVSVRNEADGTTVVCGAVEQRIECIDHVHELIQRGNFHRSCAATSMNAQSSRSHAIVRLIVTSRSKTDSSCVRESVLNLVDLAGSENSKQAGLSGMQKREGGKINQSLLSLSRVIHALSLPPKKRPKHIGYRDSKLTRILQPHLSGNACLAVLCCVSPAHGAVEETRSALRFAASAKRIQVKPVVNEVVDQQALVLSLKKELLETKDALRKLQERFCGATQDGVQQRGAQNAESKTGADATNRSMSPCETPVTEHLDLSCSSSAKSLLSPPVLRSGPASLVGSPEKTTPSRSQLLEHVVGRLEFEAVEHVSVLEGSHQNTDASSEAVIGDDSQRIEVPPVDEGVGFPMKEVVIMVDSSTSEGNNGPTRLEDRLKEAEERAKFLAEKLDTTDDLVESLFKELREEQAKTLQLAAENSELQAYIKALSKRETSTAEDMNVLLQQCLVLKCGICVGIVMYVCGEKGGFLMTILFLWLTLSVVQN